MTIQKTAFVFPGQGSQALNMLDSFKDYKEIKETFEIASESLGYDIWSLTQRGPIEKLNQTTYTQPALLTASVALWRLWHSQKGKDPNFLAGHSLGEYTAYTCSGSLSLEAAVQLVAQRGALMQEAVQDIKGAMAVIIGLSYERVSIICDSLKENEIVSPSNYNALDQIIISGHEKAVERVMHHAKAKGARFVKKLPISVPAHCALMQPATQPLANALDKVLFRMPHIPVVSNAHSLVLKDAEAIKKSLVRQLYEPVHWVNNINYLIKKGITRFIECGPKEVLTGLIRSIAPHVEVSSIGNEAGFQKALDE